jgi:hypothetical protein
MNHHLIFIVLSSLHAYRDGKKLTQEAAVSAKSHSVRKSAILAVGVFCALIGAASTVAATTQIAPQAPGPIKSGAGPGWPATLSPSDFVARVDNPWFPLQPGSEYRYTGVKGHMTTVDVMKVTDRTKRILGVRTTVVHDVVEVNGRPEEETNDFYAQDRHGNVWYFGEATKTLSSHGNTVSTEGSFQAGVKGARAGVLIPGRPTVGQVGRQEFSMGEAEDHFKVLDLSAMVSVPFVSARHALRTQEWTPLESRVLDNKYYVRGIGTVREVAVKGPVELLELVYFKPARR